MRFPTSGIDGIGVSLIGGGVGRRPGAKRMTIGEAAGGDGTYSDAVRHLATAAAKAIVSDQAVTEGLVNLLSGLDLIHSSLDVFKTSNHFASILRDVIEAALPDTVRYADGKQFAEIRRFLLDPAPAYSLQQLAALWRISIDDVRLVLHDELAAWQQRYPETPDSAFRFEWAKAVGASTTFNLLRPYDVDIALDGDFDAVRSEKWRTVPILIRLPRFITDTIAEEGSLYARSCLPARVENFILQMYQDEYRAALWGSNDERQLRRQKRRRTRRKK